MKEKTLFMLAGFGLALSVLLFTAKTNIYNYILGVCSLLSVAVFLIYYLKERSYYLNLIKKARNKRGKSICSLFDNSPDMIYYKDCDGRYIASNTSFMCANGLKSEADLIGKKDIDLYDKSVSKELKDFDNKVLSSGKAVRFLKSSKGQNGKLFIHEVVKIPVKESGKIIGIAGIARDVTEQQKLQEYLILKQAQLSSFMNNTSLFIFMLDPDGKILLGNDKFSELIGDPQKDYLGKTFDETILADYTEKLSWGLESVLVSKIATSNNLIMEQDGTQNWFKVIKSPVLDKNNRVIGASCVMSNIDEEIHLKMRRDNFLATVSHDLKTPLVAQIRALELMLNECFGKLSGQLRDIVEQIWTSNKHLHQMVSNLMSSYKNEEGVVHLQFSDLHMLKMVEEVAKEFYLLARDRNLTFEFVDKPEDDVIFADWQEIRRVVINLLSNAIAYADAGSTIYVSMYKNSNEYSLEVTNKSEYIPKEKLDTLFDKYVSLSNKFDRIGTGLGLYSSRQIVTAHNGYMLAKSSKNNVNMFGFIVPVSPDKKVNMNRREIIKNH